MNKYEIRRLSRNEYSFDTDLGLSYSIELKRSKSFYFKSDDKKKYIDLFRFSIFDRGYPVESDYKVRNTILDFVVNYFKEQDNDEILFFISNEYESNTSSRRAESRIKLFRRLFRILNKDSKFIFLTNEHFILDRLEYDLDYVGIIIKIESPNYNNIVRAFTKFCYSNSY